MTDCQNTSNQAKKESQFQKKFTTMLGSIKEKAAETISKLC